MILISAGDYLTGMLVKEAGFDGIWISGFEASARLGLPDNGSISLTEMLNIAKPVVKVGLPVYVDVDTGYGSFKRTVDEFTNIGVAGICVEDVDPQYKQNSLWGDKVPLMSRGAFARKIDVPHKIKIMARTEALIRGYGPLEAMERLGVYHNAGADILLPHSRIIPLSVTRDAKYAIVPTKFPHMTTKQLYDLGYSMVIWANQTERTKIKAIRDMLANLKERDNMMWCEENLCATLDDMKGLTDEGLHQ